MNSTCLIPKIKALPKTVQSQINDALIKAQVVAQKSNGNREQTIADLKRIQQGILRLLEDHPECKHVFEPAYDDKEVVEFYRYLQYENEYSEETYTPRQSRLPNLDLELLNLKELEEEVVDYLDKTPFQKEGDNNSKGENNTKTLTHLMLQRKLLDIRSQIAELENLKKLSNEENVHVSKYEFGLCTYKEMIETSKSLYKDVVQHDFKDLETFLEKRDLDEPKLKELQKACFDYLLMLKKLRSVCDIHARKVKFNNHLTEEVPAEEQKTRNYSRDHWKDDYIWGLFKTSFELFLSLPNPFEGTVDQRHIRVLDELVKLFDGLSIMQIHL